MAQDVVALLVQSAHPGPAIGPVTVGPVLPDDAQQPAFPRAQPISVSHIGIRQPLPQQTDELVHARLAQIGCSRRADPLHLGVVRRALRQQRPVRGEHLAPVAVRVDLRHHADHQIGVPAREID